jgi:hypothetical protein
MVVFVELPLVMDRSTANDLLGWRWWMSALGARAPPRIVYHNAPLNANSNVWDDIASL